MLDPSPNHAQYIKITKTDTDRKPHANTPRKQAQRELNHRICIKAKDKQKCKLIDKSLVNSSDIVNMYKQRRIS